MRGSHRRAVYSVLSASLLALGACGKDDAAILTVDGGLDGTSDAASDARANVGADGGGPAHSGALDDRFGDDGRVQTAFGGKSTAMALQRDGKIVMVGGSSSAFLLARYLPEGRLDPGFGSAGLITTVVSDRQQQARAVVVQPDGKLVVAGENRPGLPDDDFDFTLVRYQADGTLDPSFGAGGIVTATGVTGRAFALAIQSDGRLVAAGDVPGATDPADLQVARFNPDGTVDDGFGAGGHVTIDVVGAINSATHIVLAPDGKIVVSGDPIGLHGDPTAVARLNADGSIDSTFGEGGTVAIPDVRVGGGLALQSDGKLVLVGSIETTVAPRTTPRYLLMRLLADGSVDASFGDRGRVTTAFKTEGDQARAVTIQPDGKLLVAGQIDLVNSDFGLARYQADGQLDTSFGEGGKLTFDFRRFNDGAENVAIAPDGSIVLGGFAGDVARTGYGVARVLP